jgi:RNA polymerase sigma-70 factor (ECF subfamily)
MAGRPPGKDLIQRARNGDRDAFDLLTRNHQRPLRAIVAAQLGPGLRGRVEVEDLLQDVLLRAFRSRKQFRGETEDAFRGWLAGIAQHAVADRARRLTAGKADYRREVPLEANPAGGSNDSSSLAFEAPSPQTSPSRILLREERLQRLLEAIQTLSPDHRQVVLLTLVERLPAREVGLRMGRSDKAVSMLLLRAMRALREVFGDTSSLTLPRGSLASAEDGGGIGP